MSEITNKLKKGSPVYELVDSLEHAAIENGYCLSRWESHRNKPYKVAYAIHTGRRASQTRNQKNAVCGALLYKPEGGTERCEAYYKLKQLEKDFEKILIDLAYS